MPSERTQTRFPAFEEFCLFVFLLQLVLCYHPFKTLLRSRLFSRIGQPGWKGQAPIKVLFFELKHNFSYFLSAYLFSYFCLLQTGSRYVVQAGLELAVWPRLGQNLRQFYPAFLSSRFEARAFKPGLTVSFRISLFNPSFHKAWNNKQEPQICVFLIRKQGRKELIIYIYSNIYYNNTYICI